MTPLTVTTSPLLRATVSVADRVTGPRVSVLIFHRVLPEQDPLFPGEMHAARFDRLVSILAGGFRLMTLGQAHQHLSAGTLPPRALVITFDDGYADNADVALPILRRHGAPGTFFVASGFLDGGRMWNDSVIECFRRSERSEVDLSALGLPPIGLSDTASRRIAIDKVLPVVKYLSLAQREEALDRVHDACGRPTLPNDLMMRSEQVQRLFRQGMEIGGHTVRHPILTALDDDQANAEILRGRQDLQVITGAPVEVFAYPNGGPGRDYDARHVRMVSKAGFVCAVSTAAGVVDGQADPFQWPRFTPWNRKTLPWVASLVRMRYRRGADMVQPTSIAAHGSA